MKPELSGWRYELIRWCSFCPPLINWILRTFHWMILLSLVANGRAASYSTNFPKIENPLSENGHWTGGGTTGLDWSDCQELGGHASGTQNYVGNYNDSTAVLTGSWGADQSVQAKVVAGNTWRGALEEVELRLRSQIGPHNITGYEFDFRNYAPGGYVAIVRWNGPLNDFTTLAQGNSSYQGIKDGDILLATAFGNTLSAYVNGVLVAQCSDSTDQSGNPGIGFWLENGELANNATFGLTDLVALDNAGAGSPVSPPAAYAVWESSLLNQMRAIGIGSSQRDAIAGWLSTHPPTP